MPHFRRCPVCREPFSTLQGLANHQTRRGHHPTVEPERDEGYWFARFSAMKPVEFAEVVKAIFRIWREGV